MYVASITERHSCVKNWSF